VSRYEPLSASHRYADVQRHQRRAGKAEACARAILAAHDAGQRVWLFAPSTDSAIGMMQRVLRLRGRSRPEVEVSAPREAPEE